MEGKGQSAPELTLISFIVNGTSEAGAASDDIHTSEWRILNLLISCFRTKDTLMKNLERLELFGFNENGRVLFEDLAAGEVKFLKHLLQRLKSWTTASDGSPQTEVEKAIKNAIAVMNYVKSVIYRARFKSSGVYSRCQLYFSALVFSMSQWNFLRYLIFLVATRSSFPYAPCTRQRRTFSSNLLKVVPSLEFMSRSTSRFWLPRLFLA